MKDTQQPPRIPEPPVYLRGDPSGFVVAGTYRVLAASMYNGEVYINMILPSGHMEFARAASLAPDIARDKHVIELVALCRELRGTPDRYVATMYQLREMCLHLSESITMGQVKALAAATGILPYSEAPAPEDAP